MKLLNYLLSSFILLLAIVSAVCSFFLFEKRELLVKGWGKMATAVSKVAQELDNGSGTTLAKTLTPETMSHEQYEKLDSNLVKISDQARKVIQQRDDLGSSYRSSAVAMGMSNAPAVDSFKKLDSYDQAGKDVLSYMTTTKRRYDDTISQICATARLIGVSLNASALKESNYRTEYSKFNNRVSFMKNQISAYESGFRRCASLAGVALAATDFKDNTYSASINKVYAGIQKLKNDLNTANSMVRQKDGQIAQLNGTIKGKDKQIADAQEVVRQRDVTIAGQRRLLQEQGIPADTVLWTDGSKEARQALQGRVIEVDDRYGFIVVDIGGETTVFQKVGPKNSPVNPKIQNGTELVVVRGLDGENSKYVGRVKLFKVSDHNSYAKVLAEKEGEKVKIGDFVFIPSDVIDGSAAQKDASKKPADKK